MATKKEQTNFLTSSDLKAALLSKNIDCTPQPNWVVYDGQSSDQHLIIADMSDGSFRTINQVSGEVSFDFVEATDPSLVRAWTKRDLEIFIGSYPGVSSSETVINNGNPITYTHTIVYNNVPYNATN